MKLKILSKSNKQYQKSLKPWPQYVLRKMAIFFIYQFIFFKDNAFHLSGNEKLTYLGETILFIIYCCHTLLIQFHAKAGLPKLY